VEQAEQGVLQGLREQNFILGRDFDYLVQNAQGDMATLNPLVDNAVSQGADLLVTFSSPTLQTAIHRVKRLPIVFTYVANGVIAGAGRSSTDHLPNVTGVDFDAPYADTLDVLKQCVPHARTIGTLFVPSEVNSVYLKDRLVQEAGEMGLRVVALPASTSSEVPDAALALVAQKIDAILQVGSNLAASSYTSIAQAATKARIPSFGQQSELARQGATVVTARDCIEAGRGAGIMAARILRGESAGAIPFASVATSRLIVNATNAAAIGLRIPDAIMRQAKEVIRD
jgi:ABC-type uncharacterized transport system substrate-binding protein